MQRILLAGIMIFLIAGIVGAQDFPKVEIFGGYSLMRIGGNDVGNLLNAVTLDAPKGVATSRFFSKGFDASFTYNLNHRIGIEVASQYNTNKIMEFAGKVEQYPGDPVGYAYDAFLDINDFSLMAGPRFASRKIERITPFAHVLFGLNRIAVTPSLKIDGQDYTGEFTKETGIEKFSNAGFGFIAGGGVDVNMSKKIAVRPIQFDYLVGRHSRNNSDFMAHYIKFSFGLVVRLGGK
jgi:opacity protein-like surface antigen